jgi:hypothetical protein
MKVTRGGSFDYSNGYPATVSFRSFDNKNSKFKDLGFRCVYMIKKQNIKNEDQEKNQQKEKKKKSEKSMLKKTSENISDVANTKKDVESLFKW